MKKWVLLIVLAIAGVAAWYFWQTKPKPDDETPQLKPLSVSQHSDSFNLAMNSVMTHYYGLTEAFVNWDSNAVSRQAASLATSLEAIDFEEVKKDSTIFLTATSFVDNAKGELNTLTAGGKSLAEKRQTLNRFSDHLYNLLRTVRYDENKVYLQECPMAFNDSEPGIWLSKNDGIRNPYLGLHHPKYGKGMLECGEVKDTLNYTTAPEAAQ